VFINKNSYCYGTRQHQLSFSKDGLFIKLFIKTSTPTIGAHMLAIGLFPPPLLTGLFVRAIEPGAAIGMSPSLSEVSFATSPLIRDTDTQGIAGITSNKATSRHTTLLPSRYFDF
jgi:hypothetical protein